jgi:hypothetical protein
VFEKKSFLEGKLKMFLTTVVPALDNAVVNDLKLLILFVIDFRV